MQQVGITGGIGSGKTTTCRIFEQLGIPVYYADDRAKALMVEDDALASAIRSLLGEQAYHPDGSLNRAYVASKVFGDTGLLQGLNDLVHPAVAEDGHAWHQRQRDVPYTLKEAALLFESGSYKALDKIITVTAPKELRLQRVMERDGSRAEEVRARMNQQMPEKEKVALADFVICNDGRQSLVQQVVEVHRQLCGRG